MDDSTQKVNDKIDSLIKCVKKLKKKIEASKFEVHNLINDIREKKISKELEKFKINSQNFENKNSFFNMNFDTLKFKNIQTKYLNSLYKDFSVEEIVNKKVLKVDQKFKEKMNRSIEKPHYNYLSNNKNTWTISDEPTPIPQSDKTVSTYKDMYEKLEVPKSLNKYFMIDFDSAVFFVDGHLISSSTKEEMIKSFKKLITNDIEQKFISQYANPALLKQSYSKLINEHPELKDSRIVRAKNFYEITHLDDGTIRIIATNLSDFYSIDANDVTQHHSYSVNTTVIFSYTKETTIKHSYVIH